LKTHWKIALVFLAAALLLSGCAFSRNALISSWKENGSGLTMIFTPEGILRLLPPPPAAGAAPSAPAEISYRFMDDSSITVTPAQVLGLTENAPISFTINGDTLTLDLGGQPVVLTRVP
jgi:hypothetical protein